jgi:hypothetical protein
VSHGFSFSFNAFVPGHFARPGAPIKADFLLAYKQNDPRQLDVRNPAAGATKFTLCGRAAQNVVQDSQTIVTPDDDCRAVDG